MKAFLAIAAVLNLLSCAGLLLVARSWSKNCYREGFRDGELKGYRDGHDVGRKVGEQYWTEVERQVGEEREKIWREET